MKKNNIINQIPDIEVIDLEHEDSQTKEAASEEFELETDSAKKGIRTFLNTHVLLLAVFLIVVICIVVKFQNWGEYIDLSTLEHNTNTSDYSDALDRFLPLMDENGNIVDTEKIDTIVAFGNAPFADDRNSKDNLANLIAEASGATVYNCSVSGSYLASQWPYYDADEAPMDAYCFYWLVTLATSNGINSNYYVTAADRLGENVPPEAQEVHDLLLSIDFNEVDVVTVMYDASDYLMGHAMYDDVNPTNIQYFTGNLEAGIELLQATYPHIRIIVMSPTFAYALDENGDYVNSDMFVYNNMDVLSTYVIKEFASCTSRNVSFVDHLYGTITETNADKYLTDNVHLNLDGRKQIVNRFMDALNLRNSMD